MNQLANKLLEPELEKNVKAPILEVQNLSLVFAESNGLLHVLEEITFSVYPEEFVCILGASGSGKSTLLRVLAGLLPPTQGEILFEEKQLSGPHRQIGMVFQRANLMPWRTVEENITLPLELQKTTMVKAKTLANELIELVGLQEFESTLPRDLSGGMAQRVAIARALVHDPQLLLLDEPFGSLDALTREHMGIELLRIWQAHRKTVIMVTHDISEALLLADRVLVLGTRPGRLLLDLPIDLPRPRGEEVRYLPAFGDLALRLRSALAVV